MGGDGGEGRGIDRSCADDAKYSSFSCYAVQMYWRHPVMLFALGLGVQGVWCAESNPLPSSLLRAHVSAIYVITRFRSLHSRFTFNLLFLVVPEYKTCRTRFCITLYNMSDVISIPSYSNGRDVRQESYVARNKRKGKKGKEKVLR